MRLREPVCLTKAGGRRCRQRLQNQLADMDQELPRLSNRVSQLLGDHRDYVLQLADLESTVSSSGLVQAQITSACTGCIASVSGAYVTSTTLIGCVFSLWGCAVILAAEAFGIWGAVADCTACHNEGSGSTSGSPPPPPPPSSTTGGCSPTSPCLMP